MFDFLSRPKDNSDLVDKMLRNLARVEGQLDVYHAVLSVILSRMKQSEREAMIDAIAKEVNPIGGWPDWTGYENKGIYYDALKRVFLGVTGQSEEITPPQSN